MKKNIRHFGGLAVGIALACVALGPLAAGAQAGARALSADEVVRRVQQFYDATSDYEASFVQTYHHRLFNKTQRSYGRVFIRKPGKMRWEYDRPERKLFVSDGSTLWVYEPEAQQAFRQSLAESQLPTAIAFLAGTGNLARDFRTRLLDANRQGFAQGYVLELKPKQPSPSFERILFYVDPTTFQVVRTLVLDAPGNRNRMDFGTVRLNPGVPEARFRFTPPSGTRIITP